MSKSKTGKKPKKKVPQPGQSWLLTGQNAFLLLGAITVVVALIVRVIYLPIPFERDEGAYGYLGWMALSGGTPYVDFYEMKPPLIFYSYALVVAIFGKSPVGFHLAATLMQAIAAFYLFRLGNAVWGKGYGWIVLAAFALLGLNIQATGYSMQGEQPVLAFAIPGLYFSLAGGRSLDRRQLFIGALLLCTATLTKQNAAVFALLGTVTAALCALPLKNHDRSDVLRAVTAFAVGALTPVVAFAIILLVTGSLDEFWYWVYQHPVSYVSSVDPETARLTFNHFTRAVTGESIVIVLLTAAGLISLPFVRSVGWKEKVFLILLLVAGGLSIVPGLRFYGHYWLLFFPAWAMLVPGSAVLAIDLLGPRMKHAKIVVASALFVAFAVQVALKANTYFKPDFTAILKTVHRGNFYPEHKMIGDFLNARLQPGDQVAVLGSEPQIYLYTGRKSPTRHFYMTFTSKPIPEARQWQSEAFEDISRAKPRFLVFNFEPFSWMFKEDSDRFLYNRLYSLASREYRQVGVLELDKSPATVSRLVQGAGIATYTPQSGNYVTIYERLDE